MRLSLGTAQFGLDYGIANEKGKIQFKECKKILEAAAIAGVDTIDTAINYGNSEECIGRIGVKKYKVVTKIPKIPSNVKKIGKWVDEQIFSSLDRLKQKNIYGVLLHNPMQLLDNCGNNLYDALENLKKENIVNKIGISIYSPSELDALTQKFNFDIVQSPLNVIDNRIDKSGWLNILNTNGIEIHIRSAFLQGVLLMKKNDLPVFFKKNWPEIFDKWYEWHKENDTKPIETCLSFLLSKSKIDKLIIGVDSFSQFEEILNTYKTLSIKDFPIIESKDEILINPSKWYNDS